MNKRNLLLSILLLSPVFIIEAKQINDKIDVISTKATTTNGTTPRPNPSPLIL